MPFAGYPDNDVSQALEEVGRLLGCVGAYSIRDVVRRAEVVADAMALLTRGLCVVCYSSSTDGMSMTEEKFWVVVLCITVCGLVLIECRVANLERRMRYVEPTASISTP